MEKNLIEIVESLGLEQKDIIEFSVQYSKNIFLEKSKKGAIEKVLNDLNNFDKDKKSKYWKCFKFVCIVGLDEMLNVLLKTIVQTMENKCNTCSDDCENKKEGCYGERKN